MLVRALTNVGCNLCAVDKLGLSFDKIVASVGRGGLNHRSDVLTIQRLLNGVAPRDGGPKAILVEDGAVGPITDKAIFDFQAAQSLQTAMNRPIRDDRIDPNGPTLRRLLDLSTPRQRSLALKQAGNARLHRVELAMPGLKDAVFRAARALDAATDFLTLGSTGPFADLRERAYQRADLYFKFGSQPADRTSSELSFIRTTVNRIAVVLASPSPFGVDIFDIDPVRTHPEYRAFSPLQTGSDYRNDGTTPLRIYLCDRIDQERDDLFSHILTHELFHFVDDESAAAQIVDAPAGYRDGAMRLSHLQRMHNADNYALFVTHTAIGRARLVASQPMLDPYIPADMP